MQIRYLNSKLGLTYIFVVVFAQCTHTQHAYAYSYLNECMTKGYIRDHIYPYNNGNGQLERMKVIVINSVQTLIIMMFSEFMSANMSGPLFIIFI